MLQFVLSFILSLGIIAAAQDQLPPEEAQLLMYEQKYVNRSLDTTKIIALVNKQSHQYSPEGQQIFEVKSYWLPASRLNVFEDELGDPKLSTKFRRQNTNGQQEILFLVHPESEGFYRKLLANAPTGPQFFATATASSRTLMMWSGNHPEEVFFGKLSLDKEVAGVVRTIPKGEVARSVGISKILGLAHLETPTSFGFLPEFFGVMPKGMERGGMILRALPHKYTTGTRRLIPMFALYTRPGSRTLSPIEKMINQTDLSPQDFISLKILRPFAEQWVDLAVNHGITMEAHAQNFLMEVDLKGMPTGKFVHRDFGGFNINLQFRRTRNLAMPELLPVVTNEIDDYHQKFHEKALQQSLEIYFEGGFLFGMSERLVKMGYPDLDYENLKSMFRSEVLRSFKKIGIPHSKGQFYQHILEAIKKARAQIPKGGRSCSEYFHDVR